MASLDDLSTALRNADAAGDTDAARVLAAEIIKTRSSPVADFFKSIPHGLVRGFSGALSAAGEAANAEMGQPENPNPTPQETQQALESNVTGQTYVPQGRSGRFGAAIAEPFGNPATFVGPGGPLLKIGGAVLAGAGSEAGRQAAEGTGYETPASIGGALLGGVAAGKAFGPTVAKAATPTAEELQIAATKGAGSRYGGYEGAKASGLELDPAGVAQSAGGIEQYLYGKSFSAGPNGTAPKTFGALAELQQPPAVPGGRAFVGPANIDAVRSRLQDISREVQPTQGGAMVSTKDAAAASMALDRLNSYAENIPQSHVLAGDAAAYANATKEANANYGAFARLRDYDARLTKAERATDRNIATSIDQQIKGKAAQIIDRGAPGMSAPERAQLDLIERGTPGSNALRQLGRGGAGVVPLGMQIAAGVPTALMTGGASVLPQVGLAAALFAARKGSEAITKSRANTLAEMLAQRSPLYESRVAGLPVASSAPNAAAIARALLSTR